MTSLNRRPMLARCSQVRAPNGLLLETPILVPSFSSKGFRVEKNGKSEVKAMLEFTSEWLTDSMLISAYDIYHGYIPKANELQTTPEITIVDSGGYEAGIDHDLSAIVHNPHVPEEWTKESLISVLDSWPSRFLASFVSYDHPAHRQTFEDQVESANALFCRYPNQLHTILLKPETDTQKTLAKTLQKACTDPSSLAHFSFIGLTEKELGSSMLDRMHELAKFRLALDRANIARPIHVFGALDPLTSCLYFLAGAEVFDGLTWLRFAYRNGLCVYLANEGVLLQECGIRDDKIRAQVFTKNIHFLYQLRSQMRKFTLDGDFSHFTHHSVTLRSEYDSLRTKMRGQI